MNVDTREAVHAEGHCTPKAQQALSAISEQPAWYWWINLMVVDLILKMMFRELSKRKSRKDGME